MAVIALISLFQWQKGQIFVSNAVLRLIGNPNGIRLQWNIAKKKR